MFEMKKDQLLWWLFDWLAYQNLLVGCQWNARFELSHPYLIPPISLAHKRSMELQWMLPFRVDLFVLAA